MDSGYIILSDVVDSFQQDSLTAVNAYHSSVLTPKLTSETNDNFELFSSFITSNYDFASRSNPAGHVTASAYLLSKDLQRVLLTHHKKLNKWFQLGGHCEVEDTTLLGAAIREIKEESGILEVAPFVPYPISLDRHLIPARPDAPAHFHYDVRYALVCTGSEDFQISDESNNLRWIPISDFSHFTTEPSVTAPLETIKKLLQQ